MNRSRYFNIIEEKLSTLATRIELRAQFNLLDLHLHSEDFYKGLLNLLFGWELQNQNQINKNAEGIDLVDPVRHIVAQVSSTASKSKIEKSLSKDLSVFTGASFKFISISKDASKLRVETFLNPHNLVFDPKVDIYDIPELLRRILTLNTEQQRPICEFIQQELGSDMNQMSIESSLASIISLLAAEDWSEGNPVPQTIAFEIEQKIDYNQLKAARQIIDDYKVHHARIEKIYSEFNKMGANKSLSVLQSIRKEYLSHYQSFQSDALFFKIAERVMVRIQTSSNYVTIPQEELELCVNILVVDAFIRCKIFGNPLGGSSATA